MEEQKSHLTKYLVIGIILGIGLVVFALQNADAVEVDLLFWNFQSPLAILLVCTALIGAVVPMLTGLSSNWKKNKEIKAAQERIETLEKRLEAQLLKTTQLEASLLKNVDADQNG